jgi:hypothetical protein
MIAPSIVGPDSDHFARFASLLSVQRPFLVPTRTDTGPFEPAAGFDTFALFDADFALAMAASRG